MLLPRLFVVLLISFSAAWPQKSVSTKTAPSAAEAAAAGDAKSTRPPRVILHHRLGLRIEFDPASSRLQIWISPRAGHTLDSRDRNFSNRDDHTVLFDEIAFPQLSGHDYVRSEYDPFQTVLYYKHQTLHFFNPVHQPALLVWCEKPEVLTIKGHGSDRSLATSDRTFSLEHSERGQLLHFVAELGEGNGRITYSPWPAAGRSLYARLQPSAGQVVVLAAATAAEDISASAHRLATTSIGDLFTAQDRTVLQALQKGVIEVRDRPGLQKIIEANRSVLFSMQDASGALHQSLAAEGYLLSHRDGSLATVLTANSGWLDPLTLWSAFQLSNPTRTPTASYFGHVVDGALSGRQEDGLFYAIWSAFTHWTQSGSRRVIDEQRLALLEEAMNELERYCFDPKQNAFGRYYIGNQALSACAEYGWDGLSGRPVFEAPLMWQNKTVARSYDLYINQLAYSSYLMLAAMASGAKADAYGNKADKLEKVLESFYKKADVLPAFGTLYGEKGKLGSAEPFQPSADDYILALCISPFYSDYHAIHGIRQVALSKLAGQKNRLSWSSYWSFLAGLDPLFQNEKEIAQAIEDGISSVSAAQQAPFMAEAVNESGEMTASRYGAYAAPIGGLCAAITNTGLRRLPFGLAFRPSRFLSRLSQYEYKGRLLDVQFKGDGGWAAVSVNGQLLSHTWQLPEAFLQEGVNDIQVSLGPEPAATSVLVYSTVRLENVKTAAAETLFEMDGYGKNVTVFKNLTGQVKIRAADGTTIPYLTSKKGGFTYIECFNRGKMVVSVR